MTKSTFVAVLIALAPALAAAEGALDRHALVARHNIEWNDPQGQIPLGNGGLLYAVAMMAAGWDGAPDKQAPGFPDDGKWVVRWEGLSKAP